jgi:hypothetical protein
MSNNSLHELQDLGVVFNAGSALHAGADVHDFRTDQFQSLGDGIRGKPTS